MFDIQNMNICKESHDDYFNDSTVYTNLKEKNRFLWFIDELDVIQSLWYLMP